MSTSALIRALAESSRPTTHSDPTYVVEGVNHYAVANIPGAVPNTSTYALTNATLNYVRALANGWKAAVKADAGLLKGLSVINGEVTYKEVAKTFGLPYVPAENFL